MNKNKVRIGLIGCGSCMQWAHVPVLMKHKHAVIAAVSDPQQPQIDTLLAKAAITRPAYADYREMIRREKLDAVFISTPHSMHYEQMRFALQHGLHVLVQKPFTIRVDHAEKLMALAKQKGLYIVVSYQRFFEEKSVFAQELIANGHIGELRGVACRITQNWRNPGGWRGDPELAGGGFMMDTGSHLVSSMLRITGLKPVEVVGVAENYDKRVDLASVAILKFSNGALGTLSFFGTVRRFEESISIHGSEGYIALNGGQSRPKQLIVNDEEMTPPARFKSSSPDATLIQLIRTGGKGYEPPQTALDTIKLTQAIYRSAREGKAVKVKI